jgi:hypothetical protein
MNANELADNLIPFAIDYKISNLDCMILSDAISMLRQQHTSLISDVDVIERQYKEIQVKDEAIFNSQKQAYNLAMQVQNQKDEIEVLLKAFRNIAYNTTRYKEARMFALDVLFEPNRIKMLMYKK